MGIAAFSARVAFVLLSASVFPLHVSAQRAGQATAGGPEQSAKAFVVAQSGDDMTLLVYTDGKPDTKRLHADTLTKAEGLQAGWKISTPVSGTSALAAYDVKGKPATITFRGNTITHIVMQTACSGDFCPVKECAKKCGAKPCVC